MRTLSLAVLTSALALTACDDSSPAAPLTDTTATADAPAAGDTTQPSEVTDTADTAQAEDAPPGSDATMPDLTGGQGVAPGERAVTTAIDASSWRTIIDARDGERWVHIALPGGEGLTPSEPASDAGWAIAAQRFRVRVNGGTSGARGVQMARVDEAFVDVNAIPDGPWVADNEAADAPAEEAGLAIARLGEWYDYNPVGHTLSPKPETTFVLRIPDGDGDIHVKLWFRDYYDDDGEPGQLTFDWAIIGGGAR